MADVCRMKLVGREGVTIVPPVYRCETHGVAMVALANNVWVPAHPWVHASFYKQMISSPYVRPIECGGLVLESDFMGYSSELHGETASAISTARAFCRCGGKHAA